MTTTATSDAEHVELLERATALIRETNEQLLVVRDELRTFVSRLKADVAEQEASRDALAAAVKEASG